MSPGSFACKDFSFYSIIQALLSTKDEQARNKPILNSLFCFFITKHNDIFSI